MSISSLTTSLFATQQISGFQGFGTGIFGNAKSKAQNASSQVGSSNPVDQIQLSPAAQALLAGNNVSTPTAGTDAPTTDNNAAASNQSLQSGGNSVTQNFMNFAQMTPAQRMYQQILQSMGLTQQQLDAMTPDQRKAVTDKIQQMIKERMQEQSGVPSSGAATSSTTSSAASTALVGS